MADILPIILKLFAGIYSLATAPTARQAIRYNAAGTAAELYDTGDASNLTTGTMSSARVSGLAASATTDTTNASNISSGTLPDGRFPATLPAASGVNLTALNASNIASGTLGVTLGGSGVTAATTGGLVYGSGSNARSELAGNITATLKLLTQTGNGSVSAAPVWNTPDAAGLVDKSSAQTSIAGAKTWTGNQTFGSTGWGGTTTVYAQHSGSVFYVKYDGTYYMRFDETQILCNNNTLFIDTTGGTASPIVFSINATEKFRIGNSFVQVGSAAGNGEFDARARNFTVATLPTAGSSTKGRQAFATNGRKNGEGAGSGTGVIAFDDGSNWIAVDTGATVAA